MKKKKNEIDTETQISKLPNSNSNNDGFISHIEVKFEHP